ncbi:ABC transporter ATP-binding protein [Duganella sp. Leaf126]|nr:ABC transporter ATP-binding protein [Duganella sp. Leaf126]
MTVHGLSVGAAGHTLVHATDLHIPAGGALTLLGESGSGKSLLAQAIMGNLPSNLRCSGMVEVGLHRSDAADRAARRALWGRRLALLPQEPWLALDPTMRVAQQIAEVHELVAGMAPEAAAPTAQAGLEQLSMGDAGHKYPFQISGGMAQRVAFLATHAAGAPVMIIDEPTKGLDADRRADVLAVLRAAIADGLTLLTITHDVWLARQLRGQVAVMLAGAIVEHGDAATVLASPTHDYTRRLLAAEPAAWPPLVPAEATNRGDPATLTQPARPPVQGNPTTVAQPAEPANLKQSAATSQHAAELANLTQSANVRDAAGLAIRKQSANTSDVAEQANLTPAADIKGAAELANLTGPAISAQPVTAAGGARADHADVLVRIDGVAKRYGVQQLFAGVTAQIRRGECIAVTGPSGSGKTTFGNIVLGLLQPDAGSVTRAPGLARTAFQKLYQDPAAAFAPSVTLRQSLQDVVGLHRLAWSDLDILLARLRLRPALLDRLPAQVSGGELQRFALARVLLLRPALIFADEPTSRLDPVTQQETLALLVQHARASGCAVLLVTHDADIAAHLASRAISLSPAR